MALKALLSIVGVNEEFTVVEFEHRLSQTVNTNGVPQDGPHGGMLFVTINTPEKNYALYDWMLSSKQEDGCVYLVLNAKNKQSSFKTIHFEDAYCVNFYEYFNNHNENMMTIKLVISAEKVYFIDGDGNGHGFSAKDQREINVPVGISTKPMTRRRIRIFNEEDMDLRSSITK